jgi:hypothetical protein
MSTCGGTGGTIDIISMRTMPRSMAWMSAGKEVKSLKDVRTEYPRQDHRQTTKTKVLNVLPDESRAVES